MLKIPDRAIYVEFWQKRIGRRAASLMWWSKLTVRVSPFAAGIGFVVVFGAAKLNLPFALGLAWAVGLGTISFAMSGGVATLAAYRHAGRVMGVRITSKNFPSVKEDAYQEWRRRNGLAPGNQSIVLS
jgi:hypothetical protein